MGNIMNTNRQLIDALSKSQIYQEYEKAFSEATGLPLAIRPVESWQLPHHGRRRENRFCSYMALKNRSCAMCLEVQQELAENAVDAPATVTCPTGLCDTAVPLKLGNDVIGFLQTGQVFLKKPSRQLYERTLRLVEAWGLVIDHEELKSAWYETKVLSGKEHESVCTLLTIFAQHLSMVSNQILVRQEKAEPAVITKAKLYIKEHQEEDLSLGQVAKAVNTSTFYFCKLFKKVTGLNFTDYVSRLRIEKAKNLLLNPNLRISEIAYEVGFQSLTHFNRVFKKILGQSPTQFRQKLVAA